MAEGRERGAWDDGGGVKVQAMSLELDGAEAADGAGASVRLGFGNTLVYDTLLSCRILCLLFQFR